MLASKAFISSGGDMRLTTGQLINSGATVEALRSSQFGSMRGASKVSINDSGLLRRACT